jgi:hypothetical protein
MCALPTEGEVLAILRAQQDGWITRAGIIEVQERARKHSFCAFDLQWRIEEGRGWRVLLLRLKLIYGKQQSRRCE